MEHRLGFSICNVFSAFGAKNESLCCPWDFPRFCPGTHLLEQQQDMVKGEH